MKTAVAILTAGLLLFCSGCTWVTVPPAPGAAHVAVLDGEQVAHCQLLSKADLTAGTNLGQFKRLPADVEADLQALAVNQAAEAGADTVAPLTEVKDGHQTFGIYKCGAGTAPVATRTPARAPTTAPSETTAVKTIPYTPPTLD